MTQEVCTRGLAAFFGGSIGTIKSVAFAGSITSIGDGAFENCTALAGIDIPATVTSIGDRAFAGCSSFTSVELPSGVTELGDGAFADCGNIASVTVPQVVCSRKLADFFGGSLDKITSVAFSGAVTSIAADMFQGCTALTGIDIPAGVTSIGANAFDGCAALADVNIPAGVTSIGARAFGGCAALTRVVLPSSVTELGDGAFADCGNISSVTVPQVVCSRKLADFFGGSLDKITSVAFADGVTSIGYGAFQGCSALASVAIPAGVTSIAPGAFAQCRGLKSIDVAADNPTYKSVSGMVLTKDGTKVVAVPGGLVNVVVPEGVTEICARAFEDCGALVSVTMPSSLLIIDAGAFIGCTSLASLNFSSDAPAVRAGAFEGINQACVVYVPVNSIGWFVKDDGTWNGLHLAYSSKAVVPEFGEGGKMDPTFLAKQTPQGVLHGPRGAAVGVVTLKAGKMNKKKGEAKISGMVSIINKGKVKNIKAKAVAVKVGGAINATFKFASPIGEMYLEMDADGNFSFGNGTYRMLKAGVGGALPDGSLNFAVAIGELPAIEAGMSVVEDALPAKKVATVSGGQKFSFGKAGSLKIAKTDGGAGYELVGLNDEQKPNVSALKVTYAARTGIFRGSFNVYYTNMASIPAGGKPKLKKARVNFAGFVVNEGAGTEGIGEAYMSKPAAGPWTVWIY